VIAFVADDRIFRKLSRNRERDRIFRQPAARRWLAWEGGCEHHLLRRPHTEFVAKRFQRRMRIVAMSGQCEHLAALVNKPSRFSRIGEEGNRLFGSDQHQNVDVPKQRRCRIDWIGDAGRCDAPTAALHPGDQNLAEQSDVPGCRDLPGDRKPIGSRRSPVNDDAGTTRRGSDGCGDLAHRLNVDGGRRRKLHLAD
jgi:hypothetical protein